MKMFFLGQALIDNTHHEIFDMAKLHYLISECATKKTQYYLA